jgi:D-amino-acid dehydrogenase
MMKKWFRRLPPFPKGGQGGFIALKKDFRKPRPVKNTPDVIIVGGGVIGLCTAYFAADTGAKILVLEKDQYLSAACSVGNAGFLAPSHCLPLAAPGAPAEGMRALFNRFGPLSIRFRLDPSFIVWLVRFIASCRKSKYYRGLKLLQELCWESMTLHEMLSKESKGVYQFRRSGMICVYEDKRAFAKGMKHARSMKFFNTEYRIFPEQPFINTSDLYSSIYYPTNGYINPSEFLDWLGKRCREKGVEFKNGSEVIGFETRKRKITKVLSTHGEFLGNQVVICAGIMTAHLLKLLGVPLFLQAAKGYSLTYDAPNHGIAYPVLLEKPRLAITPFKNQIRVAGVLDFSGIDYTVNYRRIARMHRDAGRWLPLLTCLKPVEIWRGWRPCPTDSLPIISRNRRIRNLLVATGHGTKGMLLGPATGQRMAALLIGKS